MKKYSRLLLWCIILLTALAVIIDAPKTKPFKITTPKLPGLNRTVSVILPFAGSTIGNREFPFHEGLDLAGGTSITLRADMTHVAKDQRSSALDSAKVVIERRVNALGVGEATIQTSQANSDYRMIVDLPGINVDQAVKLIGTTAQLSFWEVGASGSGKFRDPQTLPAGILQLLGIDAKETDLTGKDLKSSSVVFDPNTGNPQIQLVFTSDGTKKFAEITKQNIGKLVVIVLDNQVISYPTVQSEIVNGNAVISGQFTTDQASRLSIELQAGALPVPLSILQQQSVGATLGQDSLQKSLFAGILGFIIIVVFMIILYGRLGAIASLALVLYALFVMAIFKAIPVTLTLAGIAGFVLSVGMAVDANILIFERTKEELRSGRPQSNAITLGFTRAWSSIRDSNISTLITSFILYQFGTGIVKGFALTLAIGVLVSMFSAIVVTRTLLKFFYRH